MIGLDTNILARFFLGDDSPQHLAARELVSGSASEDAVLFVSAPVLCELVWVMERTYRIPRSAVRTAILALVNADGIVVESADAARAALADWENGRSGFVDYFVGQLGRSAGCKSTLTFDRALGDHPNFSLLT